MIFILSGRSRLDYHFNLPLPSGFGSPPWQTGFPAAASLLSQPSSPKRYAVPVQSLRQLLLPSLSPSLLPAYSSQTDILPNIILRFSADFASLYFFALLCQASTKKIILTPTQKYNTYKVS